MPTDNESWLIETGDRVIRRTADVRGTGFAPWDTLVYALWWADYAMRNGESLAAADYTSDFHANGRLAAGELSLPLAQGLFALDLGRFEAEYLNRFETVCDEIRVAEPAATADHRSGSE